MIRSLRPTDILRHALFNSLEGVNRAQGLDELLKGAPTSLSTPALSREALSFRRRCCSLVSLSQGRLTGLASARERAGPKAWEVVHLFLSPGQEEGGAELLEHLGQEAAQRGAERLFLRLRRDDHATDIARRAGFFPCFLEFLYRGRVPRSINSSNLPPPLRPRMSQDDHPLFRLYNAVTPPKVRPALGLTLEEWKDSQERPLVSFRELVSEDSGTIKGWLRMALHPHVGQLDIVIHPEEEGKLGCLVDYGLRSLSPKTSAVVIVPEYQLGLLQLLEERGFQRASEYHTMVKFLASRVKEKAVVPARATPI